MPFTHIKARTVMEMAATWTILEFHARLHGSEVIALNDADAYATSGAYFCVSSYTRRVK